MGSLRLGRLPKTLRWRELINLLDEMPTDTSAVARKTAEAAETQLRLLGKDKALTYCFWLLTRITWAARSPDFADSLGDTGIELTPDSSILAFVARVSDRVSREVQGHPESGPFGELASLALRSALSNTIGQHGRSLFGSSVEDLQDALRSYSRQAQFGTLSRHFFGDFFSRTLRYFVDKELSNHVGEGHGLSNIGESQAFGESLNTYAFQSARIMEDFAGGWYSKHNWEQQGRINQDEAGRFVAVALRKLRMELKREEQR